MLLQNQSIKTWAEDDRPREKLLLKGKRQLSDSELIAILLNSGSRNQSALELAKEILRSAENDLNQFSKLSFSDFTKFKGVGEAKAITLIAALELGRRRKEFQSKEKLKLKSPAECFAYFKPYFEELHVEEFHVIFLNNANIILGHKQLSIGGLTGTVVDARVLFKEAINLLATGIILAHNHPSGQLKPSDQDLRLTKRISEFGKMIDITVLDHLILTDTSFLSFSEQGLL
jgi:DNA repair protein RadC